MSSKVVIGGGTTVKFITPRGGEKPRTVGEVLGSFKGGMEPVTGSQLAGLVRHLPKGGMAGKVIITACPMGSGMVAGFRHEPGRGWAQVGIDLAKVVNPDFRVAACKRPNTHSKVARKKIVRDERYAKARRQNLAASGL